MLLGLLFLIFLLLLAFRAPLGVALSLSSFVVIVLAQLNPVNLVTNSYRTLDSFALLAIPFFLLIGMFTAYTSLAQRLLDLADLLVGRIRGGLGHVNVVSSMLFGGVSGSATADVASLGAVLIPMMKRRGYSAEYSAAITAASSTMGLMLPPSIVMIVYGAFVNTSIGALFLTGILPGIVLGLLMLFINFVHVRRKGIDARRNNHELSIDADADALDETTGTAPLPEEATAIAAEPGSERKRASTLMRFILPRASGALDKVDYTDGAQRRPWYATVVRGLPIMFIPVLIVVGIRGGILSPTEAGAMALVYLVLLVAVFYRELNAQNARTISRESLMLTAQILFAVAASGVFGWVLSMLGAAQAISGFVQSGAFTPTTYLLMVVAIFTVIGTFIDAVPAVIIFAPLFSGAALSLGIHPVHLGIVVVAVLGMGLLTPPYGLSLLIAARLAKITIWQATKAIVPFWAAGYFVIIALAMSEEVALFLPRLLAPDLF